jgi:signal transduction histidine kinase
MMSRREATIFRITTFVFLAAATMVGFMQTDSTLMRGVMVALLAAIGILSLRSPSQDSPQWQKHSYLGLQGVMVLALTALVPGWTLFPTLYCLLTVQAILLLSLNPGTLWVVAYVAMTSISFAVSFNLREGMMAIIIYGGLNAFFAAYASALLRANVSRNESQALLAELQQAHEQLQSYALRAEEMAVVEERNRLAREMHDTLGHRLTVASVQLEAAQRLCPTEPERAASMVETVREQVREALGELRATVATLRAPVEADLQLRSALQRLATHYEEATGSSIHQVLPDSMPRLPEAHRLALFRAAQEALTNIQKHAKAKRVWLVLSVGEDWVTLLVSDDGKGVSMSGKESGFGLQGLRERAEQLGGELHLEPRSGGGTELSFRLPLAPEEDGND